MLVPPEPVSGFLPQAPLTPLTKHHNDHSALGWDRVLLASEHFSHGLVTGSDLPWGETFLKDRTDISLCRHPNRRLSTAPF